MWDPYAQFESTVLPNGLGVHVLHLPERAGVHMHFGIHSGARHDLPGREGAAHYMEHLVNCNGGSSAEEIKEFFDSNTGHSPGLGMTSFFWTSYNFHSSAEAALLSRSLEFFGNMLLHGNLKNYMERERVVIVGEYRRHFPTDVAEQLMLRLQKVVFPNTVFSRMISPLGSLESIRAMTERDLQDFYDAHYTPRNMQIVAVGELSLSEIVSFLTRSPFSAEKPGERSALIEPFSETPLPTQQLEVFKLGEYQQGMNSAEYVSVAQLPDIYSINKLGVVYRMLKERLFNEVRQKRSWAYGISCGHSGFGGDFREFSIHCKGLQLDAVDDIEQIVTSCIDTLPQQNKLFSRAKASGLAFGRFSDPSTKDIAESALKDLLNYGRIVPTSEELAEIEEVTLDDVASIAQRLSRDRRFTSLRVP